MNDRCPHCGSRYATWTPATIVAAGQAWHAEHGRPPSIADWERAAPEHPTKRPVYEHFGSWPVFIAACGLTRPERWSRDRVLEAFYRFRFLHGRLPRSSEWTVSTGEFPSRHTVRTHFGSWNAAVVAAGYTPQVMHRTEDGYARQAGAAVRVRSADGAFAGAEA